MRADDPWADRSSIDVVELAERRLVLLTPDFHPRTLLDEAMDAADVGSGEHVEVTHAQVAQAIAAAGRGVAVVSDDPRFDLVPLRIDSPPARSASASTPPGTRATTRRPPWLTSRTVSPHSAWNATALRWRPDRVRPSGARPRPAS